MEFFEGKRVRELRATFEGALDVTLEPVATQVRNLDPHHSSVCKQSVEWNVKLSGKPWRGKKSSFCPRFP